MILLADRIEDGVAGQETIGGLDITVRRNAFGRQVDSFEEDLARRRASTTRCRAVFIRAPWVEQAGDGVEVLARVEAGPAAGRIVAVRQGSLMATSFHPEVGGDARVHAHVRGPGPLGPAPPYCTETEPETEEGPMSGHSKWATTKHKKAAIDAKRGKLFAKLIKNIEVAAKQGGGDLAGNPTLYDAIQKAKKSSVPNKNIDSALKRGSGAESGGVDYETIFYEVYGPQGVAILVECLTDNKNRAAMEVRTAVTRNGGTMADPGSVSRLFTPQGRRDGAQVAGGPRGHRGRRARGDPRRRAPRRSTTSRSPSRCSPRPPTWSRCAPRSRTPASTTTPPTWSSSPSMEIPVDADGAGKVFRLVDALEDLDDVQNVFTNVDVPDDVLAELEAADA